MVIRFDPEYCQSEGWTGDKLSDDHPTGYTAYITLDNDAQVAWCATNIPNSHVHIPNSHTQALYVLFASDDDEMLFNMRWL